MRPKRFTYVIVGTGLAGVSAVEGIREIDKEGSILLIGEEPHLPYDRPPLSKDLWKSKKKEEEIILHDKKYYDEHKVNLLLARKVTRLKPLEKTIIDDQKKSFHYEKLLLATGGVPRVLGNIPGGNLPEICYYRNYDDFKKIKALAVEGASAVIVGGGFIGSEMAAALNMNKVKVTMIFPEAYLVQRIFPPALGNAIQDYYRQKGVNILNGDVPVSFEKNDQRIITRTKNGQSMESEIVIAGAGIIPAVELAQDAGLAIENGIVVDSYFRTSDPYIYSAGDNTLFPYIALGKKMRIEHWDNSLNQGKHAGKNMAGANLQFNYMPFFYSDLFEFGYEAVGDINSQLETFADWQKENETGVIYYLKEGKVKGVMNCNVWDKIETARQLIRKGNMVNPGQLKGI